MIFKPPKTQYQPSWLDSSNIVSVKPHIPFHPIPAFTHTHTHTQVQLFPEGVDKPPPCRYSVITYTSDIRGAGTDANVSCIVFGDKGQTSLCRLENSKNNFERGQVGGHRRTCVTVCVKHCGVEGVENACGGVVF